MSYIETELYKTLGRYLRVAREASGLTLSDVANKIDTTLMTIQRYEKGDRKITVEKIRLLCSLYGVDADKLMQDSINSIKLYTQSNSLSLKEESYNFNEQKCIKSFRKLNDSGQGKVLNYMDDLAASGNYSTGFDCQLAAHDRTDVQPSAEERQHDLDLLNSNDF